MQGHYKLYFCFWSWIFPRIMRAGNKSASQPPIQVNQAHLNLNICASLCACGIQNTEDAENLEMPKACRQRTRNRSICMTWSSLKNNALHAHASCNTKIGQRIS